MTVRKAATSRKAAISVRSPNGGHRTSTSSSGRVGRPPLIEQGWDAAKGTWKRGSVVSDLLGAVRHHLHLSVAAASVGVSRAAVNNWLARGREWSPDLEVHREEVPVEHRPYVDFLAAYTQVRASAEVGLISTIEEIGLRGDWRALMAIASRSYSERWHEKSTLVIEHNDPSDDDDLQKLIEADPSVAVVAEAYALAIARARGPEGDDPET